MDGKLALRHGLGFAKMVSDAYLGDLTDEELLVRTIPGCNHIAWQLGHLISSERQMIEGVAPGSMPALPDGFSEKYTKETAASDDPAAFDNKAEFMRLAAEQREALMVAIDKLNEADFDKPAPKEMQDYAKTIGDVFAMQAGHWLMHAGQWAVTRRKLGRAPLF